MNVTGMLFRKLESTPLIKEDNLGVAQALKDTLRRLLKKKNQIIACVDSTPPLNENRGERHLSTLRDFV